MGGRALSHSRLPDGAPRSQPTRRHAREPAVTVPQRRPPHAVLADRRPRALARPEHRHATHARLARAAGLVRLAILLSAGVWLATGDGSAAAKALLVLPPALLGRVVRIHPGYDLLWTSALAAEETGTALGAYNSIGWGDTLSHFVLPFLIAPILYLGLVRLGAAAGPRGAPSVSFLVGSALMTAAAVLALGALWELVEWAVDSALGTNFSQGYTDTLVDLLADAVAAVLGGAMVGVWLGKGR